MGTLVIIIITIIIIIIIIIATTINHWDVVHCTCQVHCCLTEKLVGIRSLEQLVPTTTPVPLQRTCSPLAEVVHKIIGKIFNFFHNCTMYAFKKMSMSTLLYFFVPKPLSADDYKCFYQLKIFLCLFPYFNQTILFSSGCSLLKSWNFKLINLYIIIIWSLNILVWAAIARNFVKVIQNNSNHNSLLMKACRC